MYQGWKVTLAGFVINLVTGVVYTWSIIASALVRDLGWSYTEASLPYNVFYFCYPPAMIAAGRLQDLIGPQRMVIAGAILMGGGNLVGSFNLTPTAAVLIWGLCWGCGLACCFASVTPAAIKWFPPEKKGLVTGIVVFSMGFSAVIMAPLMELAINRLTLPVTLRVVGIFLLASILLASVHVKNPPCAGGSGEKVLQEGEGVGPLEIFRYPQLYMLWIMFCFVAGTGITFYSHLDTMARVQFSYAQGFLMVSLIALFNALGRVVAGYLLDRWGWKLTMSLIYCVMTLVLAGFFLFRSPSFLAVAVSALGLAYGGLFTLFPAVVSLFFGEKNFGFFYGLIFSGMTVGALFPLFAGYLFEQQGDFSAAFTLLFFLNAVAVGLIFFLRQPRSTVGDSRIFVKNLATRGKIR